MKLVDVHNHINASLYKKNFEKFIQDQIMEGMQSIIISGTNPKNNREVLQLSKKYPIIKASLGVYPTDAIGINESGDLLPTHEGEININEELKFFEENLEHIISIGEIGMDFYQADKSTYNKQNENFMKILDWCKKHDKSVVIHSRKAEKECLETLSKYPELRVINHCFSGKKKLIKQGVELGHFFSVPPSVVHAQNFQILVEIVPLNQLLTETDSPFMGPNREWPNKPSNSKFTIQKIAEIKNLSEDLVEKQILENYKKAFNVDEF